MRGQLFDQQNNATTQDPTTVHSVILAPKIVIRTVSEVGAAGKTINPSPNPTRMALGSFWKALQPDNYYLAGF